MADTWHVTTQKLDTVINPEGNGFSQQWNIGYLVLSGPAQGVRGEIHVPLSQYDAGTVKETIGALVKKHHEIHSI